MLTSNTDLAAEDSRSGARSRRSLAIALVRGFAQAILMTAILAAALMATWRLIATKPEVKTRPPFPTVYSVETVRAERGDYRPAFTVYGETVASRSVELRSLVSGEVTSVSPNLKPGALVQQGEALVGIDRFNYEGALREAEANVAETRAKIQESRSRIAIEENKLLRAREQFEFAQRDLERIGSLRESGSATDKQAEEREFVASQRRATVEQTEINIEAEKSKLAQQQAALERLEWKRDQAERNLRDTVLAAPFTGVVRTASAEAGRMVGANDVVVTLYERDNMEVRFTLTDERYGRIEAGDDPLIGRKVKVRWTVGSSERLYEATIVRIGAEIAAARGGVEVYARLDETGNSIRPGAFVQVSVPDRRFAGHFRIPESAIYGGDTVYLDEGGVLKARKIAVAAWDGEYALVADGLDEGAQVLTTRISEIGEGLRVERREAAK